MKMNFFPYTICVYRYWILSFFSFNNTAPNSRGCIL